METAILQTGGHVSVQLKSNKQPATPSDLNIQIPNIDLPILVIEDGNILNENLKYIKMTRALLLDKFHKQGVKNPSKVMLAQVDTSGNVYVDLYDDNLNLNSKQSKEKNKS